MHTTIKNVAWMLGLVAGLSACRFDDQQTKLQYMPDMADSPTVKSQESFINPPDGSVALTTANDVHQVYPATFEESDSLVMPLDVANDPEGLLRGKLLYTTFCAVCHSGDGRSQESVVGKWVVVSNLLDEKFVNYTDGELFYRITFGTSVMPGYGYAIDIEERWQIVRYLRELQQN